MGSQKLGDREGNRVPDGPRGHGEWGRGGGPVVADHGAEEAALPERYVLHPAGSLRGPRGETHAGMKLAPLARGGCRVARAHTKYLWRGEAVMERSGGCEIRDRPPSRDSTVGGGQWVGGESRGGWAGNRRLEQHATLPPDQQSSPHGRSVMGPPPGWGLERRQGTPPPPLFQSRGYITYPTTGSLLPPTW